MKVRTTSIVLLIVALASGCKKAATFEDTTVLLGSAHNLNSKCIGHAAELCGPEKEDLRVGIAGIFATEPNCQGLRLRGLTEKEKNVPSDQLPLLLDVYYVGTHQANFYNGTGKNEDEGWMYTFNGPKGHFSETVKTSHDVVGRVCLAAKGLGGSVDKSVGYTH